MTGNLVLAGAMIALVGLTVWLLLREARARGRAEAETQAATDNQETLSDVQKIQAGPLPSRSELIDRMRARSGGDGSSLPPA